MRKITFLSLALTLSVGLAQAESVFTYTATEKLESNFNNLGTPASHEYDENTDEGMVTFNDNVTTIGQNAFSFCMSLTEVTVAWTTADKIPAINADVFSGIANSKGPSDATLHVPAGAKALYEAKDVWKTFGTIDTPADPLAEAKTEAIAAIEAAAEGVTDEKITIIVTDAKTRIGTATSIEEVTTYKTQALADIALAKAKADAIAEIDLALTGVTDESIKAIAEDAKTRISTERTIEDVTTVKTFALSKLNTLILIQTARQGIQNAPINNWINAAINDIKRAGPNAEKGIDEIKEEVMTVISLVQIGIEDGKAELLGDMGEPCTDCTAIKVSDGETTITLYNAKTVDYEVIEN